MNGWISALPESANSIVFSKRAPSDHHPLANRGQSPGGRAPAADMIRDAEIRRAARVAGVEPRTWNWTTLSDGPCGESPKDYMRIREERSEGCRQGKAAKPKLLSGGNPQIPKGDGDAPVQAYIAAMPGWKCEVGRYLDALIERSVPDVRKGGPMEHALLRHRGPRLVSRLPLFHEIREGDLLQRCHAASRSAGGLKAGGRALFPRVHEGRRARRGTPSELGQAGIGAARRGRLLVASGRHIREEAVRSAHVRNDDVQISVEIHGREVDRVTLVAVQTKRQAALEPSRASPKYTAFDSPMFAVTMSRTPSPSTSPTATTARLVSPGTVAAHPLEAAVIVPVDGVRPARPGLRAPDPDPRRRRGPRRRHRSLSRPRPRNGIPSRKAPSRLHGR